MGTGTWPRRARAAGVEGYNGGGGGSVLEKHTLTPPVLVNRLLLRLKNSLQAPLQALLTAGFDGCLQEVVYDELRCQRRTLFGAKSAEIFLGFFDPSKSQKIDHLDKKNISNLSNALFPHWK